MARFRKAYMRAFCYSIHDMNYRQIRAYALYGFQYRQNWTADRSGGDRDTRGVRGR